MAKLKHLIKHQVSSITSSLDNEHRCFWCGVYRAVLKIPKGQVATYGQIAALIFSPRAARQVGLALKNLNSTTKIPWHRVVNREGMISIENLAVPKVEQARRLQEEGIKVEFVRGNWWVDLSKYLWENPK